MYNYESLKKIESKNKAKVFFFFFNNSIVED